MSQTVNDHEFFLLTKAIGDCIQIIESRSLINVETPSFVKNSLFAWLITNLHDCLQQLNLCGVRVSFKEDIKHSTNKNPNPDVTDLVADLRNLLCHPKSAKHMLPGFVYCDMNSIFGKSPPFIEIENVKFGCDYEDDGIFIFGNISIYLRRNICRAVEEAQAKLSLLRIVNPDQP